MHVNFRVEEKCGVSEGGAVASEDWAVVGLGVAARVEGCDLGPVWIFEESYLALGLSHQGSGP